MCFKFGSVQVLISPLNWLATPCMRSYVLLSYTSGGAARWIYKRGQFVFREVWERRAFIANSKENVIFHFKFLQGFFKSNLRSIVGLNVSSTSFHVLRVSFWIYCVILQTVKLRNKPEKWDMFIIIQLYVYQIGKEKQTLHTYLKKGW